MSIEEGVGSIFDSGLDSLVNPVNCVGVSGKGLALEFKRRLPDAVAGYETAARAGSVKVGAVTSCFSTRILAGRTKGTLVYHFPTKWHWRDDSDIDWVKKGLEFLSHRVRKNVYHGFRSVGIPALGCGEGRLSWSAVRPLIVKAFQDSPARVVVYGPLGGR